MKLRCLWFSILLLLITACVSRSTPRPLETPTTTLTHNLTPTYTIRSTNQEATTPSVVTIFDTWTRPSDSAVMVFVPGGSFLMGSSEAELEAAFELCEQYRGQGKCNRSWFDDERPQHEVTLDSFWIDKTEVTNGQFDLCVKAGGCTPLDCENDFPIHEDLQPVGCVTWFDANSYCQWASARLPTEAEWEYAARGSKGYIFPWGNTFDPTRLNYCDFNCTYKWSDESYDDGYTWPAPVGSFESGTSWCGAQDMAGNNWEWVADWYAPRYYEYSPTHNPRGPESGSERVIRGGSAHFFPAYVRSSRRSGIFDFGIYASGGFRCAADHNETLP